MLLHSLGVNAVTTTAGATSFDEAWSHYFRHKDVSLMLDNDSAGSEGAEIISRAIKQVTSNLRIIKLPTEYAFDKVKDVTDYVKAGGDVFKLLNLKRRI